MIYERIGCVEYDKPFSWRLRLALWLAPELRDEIAHWADQARGAWNRLDVMREA